MTAAVGNGVGLMIKPIEYLLGAAPMALAGDFSQLRRGLYAFNSFDAQGPTLKRCF